MAAATFRKMTKYPSGYILLKPVDLVVDLMK